ncbi:MAG: YvcK family protein, partial [Actinobacteria bacterium]|nr:YvcK family protein [Actinomycetota bacterium]
FAEGVTAASRMLEVQGRVHPATTELVSLGARTEGGVLRGQAAVASAGAPIESVFLDPSDAPAYPEAVRAITEADQIVLGPGSLYTSLIPALLIPGIGDAVRQSKARRIFVCNTRMQKGETEGLDVNAHVAALLAHTSDDCVDVVVAQFPPVEPDGVAIDASKWRWKGVDLFPAHVATSAGNHDRDLLSQVLAGLG